MKVADIVRKYWDEAGAEAYDTIHYMDSNKLRKTLLNHMDVPKGGIVLDFGTGTGRLASLLANVGYRRILGVDINEHMLGIAGRKLPERPILLVQGDGLHLPLEKNSVDAVVSKWVLWALPDPEKAVREMARVTKPEGEVLTFTSGSFDDEEEGIWDKLRGPLKEIHNIYIEWLHGEREIDTDQFWKETESKLPQPTVEEYVQIFKDEGLKPVQNTEMEEFGSFLGRLIFGGFEFSLIKGRKPGKNGSGLAREGTCWEVADLQEVLSCPACRGEISQEDGTGLTCESCGKTYPIKDGIPILLPPEDELL